MTVELFKLDVQIALFADDEWPHSSHKHQFLWTTSCTRLHRITVVYVLMQTVDLEQLNILILSVKFPADKI